MNYLQRATPCLPPLAPQCLLCSGMARLCVLLLLWPPHLTKSQATKSCGPLADCRPQEGCPSFLASKSSLLADDGCQSEGLLADLRSRICDAKSRRVCCATEQPPPADEPGTSEPQNVTCGLKIHSLLSLRVVGGEDSTAEDNPWNVVLERAEEERADRIVVHCGGTVLGPRHVLTAAHCVWVGPPWKFFILNTCFS